MNHLLLTFLAIAQFSGQPVVATHYTAKRLTVGDRFEVRYTVSCGNAAKVTGPLADSLGAFIVVDQRPKIKAHQGYNDNIYTVQFAGFKPGDAVLPPVRFLVQTGDRMDTLTSDSVKLVIASVLPPTMAAINDIKPAISFPNYWLWLIPAAIALLALAVYLGYVLYQKLRRIKELASAPLSPWDEALRALDQLPVQDWLAQGQVQTYYYALSEILKRYIERRYGFNAAEQTTSEIIAAFKRLKVPFPFYDEFVMFIKRADLVKYAKHQPSAEELPLAIEIVRGIVVRSRPVEPAVAPSDTSTAAAATGAV
jgi:hypothetical protein